MPKTRRLDYRRLNWKQVVLPSLKLLSTLPTQFCQQSPHPLPTQVQVLFWFCLDWPPQGQVSRNILTLQMCGFNPFQFSGQYQILRRDLILMLLLQMSSWKVVSPRGERLVESEDNLKYFCQISAAYRSVRSSQSHVCHFCHPCNFCHISQVCHMQQIYQITFI